MHVSTKHFGKKSFAIFRSRLDNTIHLSYNRPPTHCVGCKLVEKLNTNNLMPFQGAKISRKHREEKKRFQNGGKLVIQSSILQL